MNRFVQFFFAPIAVASILLWSILPLRSSAKGSSGSGGTTAVGQRPTESRPDATAAGNSERRWFSKSRAQEDRAKTLIIGRVSHSPKKHYKRLKPIVNYVVSHLHDLGFTRGAVVLAESNEEMLYLLKTQKR
jgi:hypothetical protein